MKKTAVIFSCALLGFACVFARENRAAGQGKVAGARANKAPAAEAPLPQIDKERIRAHVKYLSSDELEGRGTRQRGGDRAADYIGKQFASYGLKPAGENGTFFQPVPMVGVKTLPETTFKFAEASGKSFEAKNLIDFVTNNEGQTVIADTRARGQRGVQRHAKSRWHSLLFPRRDMDGRRRSSGRFCRQSFFHHRQRNLPREHRRFELW